MSKKYNFFLHGNNDPRIRVPIKKLIMVQFKIQPAFTHVQLKSRIMKIPTKIPHSHHEPLKINSHFPFLPRIGIDYNSTVCRIKSFIHPKYIHKSTVSEFLHAMHSSAVHKYINASVRLQTTLHVGFGEELALNQHKLTEFHNFLHLLRYSNLDACSLEIVYYIEVQL